MKKLRIDYDSPIDALIAVTKRLSVAEDRHRMTSEEFYDKFTKGQLEDSICFTEWANDYQHFVATRYEIEKHLSHVA